MQQARTVEGEDDVFDVGHADTRFGRCLFYDSPQLSILTLPHIDPRHCAEKFARTSS
ncbi:hypothetical protein [Streptomyces cupreus]|uniref:hypothetical protein n=1 Tax=Streptomyces cupreus TaxID=2759956 RepID=UPI0021B24CC3|nr:hypothetical protein [Streptomyces cupreus]